ncbi:hypothetical protein FOMPIDRAFT_92477 [Fomitopsis schrenkii]|uniref:Uncharacterized protein n=1 Tax=Fomitopsis schrenkii TaxID=2126942 RepID=S8F163_FOMSC|nr:hypothetical protein FOMPIDRAFT_92477 [Fomitopsis schrenkii]
MPHASSRLVSGMSPPAGVPQVEPEPAAIALPPEVWDRVIDELWDDRDALAAGGTFTAQRSNYELVYTTRYEEART